MKHNGNLDTLIELAHQYVEGSISEQAKILFEQKMKTEPELTEMVQFFRTLNVIEEQRFSSVQQPDSVKADIDPALSDWVKSEQHFAGNVNYIYANKELFETTWAFRQIAAEHPPSDITVQQAVHGQKLVAEHLQQLPIVADHPFHSWLGRRKWLVITSLTAVILTIILLLVGPQIKTLLQSPAEMGLSGVADYEFMISGEPGSMLEQVADLYRNSSYAKAYTELEGLYEEELQKGDGDAAFSNTLLVYMGICQARLKNWGLAKMHLIEAIQSGEIFIDIAVPQLYYGLILFQENNYEAARPYLEAAQNSVNPLMDGQNIRDVATEYLAKLPES